MNIEDQITALLAKAEPLRLLDDIEAEAQCLGRIVEQINALRAQDEVVKIEYIEPMPAKEHANIEDAIASQIADNEALLSRPVTARKPGRPKKIEAA